MNFTPFPELNTERLILRQIVYSDREEVFFLRSDENVNLYIDRPRPKNLEDADEFISMLNREITENTWIDWGITLKIEPKLLGSICLWNFSDDKTRAEIGYELNPEYQGQGIMNEALEKVMDFGFQSLGLNEIDAYTHKENLSSTKLLLKNGFIRDSERFDKENADNIFFTKARTQL